MPRPNPRRAAGAPLPLRTSLLWLPLVVGACSTGADLVQAEQAAEQAEIRQAGLDALEAAAAAGDLASQMRLASMYYDGRTLPRERGKAAVWYRAAADQGDTVKQLMARVKAERLASAGAVDAAAAVELGQRGRGRAQEVSEQL